MKKKQAMHRQFNVPDADLYVQCLEKLKFAQRDLAEFIKYGFSESRLKGFYNLCQKFQEQPDDDELVGEQMLSTEKKMSAADELRAAIRSVMTRVEMKYSNRSGRYRKFGTTKLSEMTDAQLLFCGRRVIRVSRLQVDFLSDVGITEITLRRVHTAISEFENLLNIQQDKVHDRDIAVEGRIELSNKMYQELVVLCNIGKDIWDNKDVPKYENYVLYESNNEQKKARKAENKAEEV